MTRSSTLQERLDRERTVSPAHRLLQLLVLAGGLLAVVTTHLVTQGGPLAWACEIGAVVGLLLAAARPESAGAVVLVLALATWWFFGATDAPWWGAGVAGIGLLVAHQACAWAATGPPHAVLAPAVAGWMATRLVALGLASGLALTGLGLTHQVPVGEHSWPRAGAVLAVIAVVVGLVLVRDQPDA